MGAANLIIGYLAGVALATFFYVVWTLVSFSAMEPHVSFLFRLGFTLFWWLFQGTAVALVSLFFPWCLVVWGYRRLQYSGLVYFGLIGAAATFIIGCGTASLSWKPLFVEDQTFLQGFMIAVERQGVCLLLTGLVFGLTYWFVSERQRQTPLNVCGRESGH